MVLNCGYVYDINIYTCIYGILRDLCALESQSRVSKKVK